MGAFTIPTGATQLRAYEWCNLHGLFEGPPVSVTTAGTGPAKCTRDGIDTSAMPSFIADLNRRQQLIWDSPPFTEALGAKHTPYITIQGNLGTVIVGDGSPYHPMSGGSDPTSVHFITHIYVVDQSGNIVAMQNLDPTGMDIASISFTIPRYTTSLTAYEFCNLHGLWQGPTVVVDLGPPAEVNTEPQGQLFQLHHWIIGGGLLGVLLVGCVGDLILAKRHNFVDHAKSPKMDTKEVDPEIGVDDPTPDDGK